MPYHLTGVPLNPFALKKGEHLERPKVLRQLAFEDVYPRAYMYTAAFFARAIVPIELVKLGDKQVVVLSKTDERTPPLSINFLAEFPSVVSVVADRLVIASRPLPHIRELFVLNFGATVDQETLSNLPGLVSLSLGSGWGARELELEEVNGYNWEADKIDLNVLRHMEGLRDLRFHTLAVRSIEPLNSLKGLERLRIEGISSERNAAPLAGLTKLRWLALEYWRGLRSLRGLVNLERVELMEISLANLKAFKNWKKLRSLALSGRGVKSLEGIGELDSLEDLFLGGTGIQDLAPLVAAVNINHLKLASPDRVEDFSPINRLENLRSLAIELGSITSTGHLGNIDFLRGLKHLEELEIRGALIDDGRLDALLSLPKIRRVRLFGDYGDQVEELRQRKPGCDIQVIPLPPERPGELIQAGSLTIYKYEEHHWYISQDLSDLLGVGNNFSAARKARQLIRERDPDLLNRLDFDPDADFVAIHAKNEADIRRAADIIQSVFDTPTDTQGRQQ